MPEVRGVKAVGIGRELLYAAVMTDALPELLERLINPDLKPIDLGLDRVQAVLERLGHPERRLPPVVHVAGTNGKGSTLAFLRAMLEAAGVSCHVYTSPHLVRFNERIVFSGHEALDGELVSLIREVLPHLDAAPLTFFEATTVAALLGFAEHPADVTLLETGLGGRLDATNVVDAPRACVITPVSFDHKEFLGDTVAAIAGEKAGIIKPGVPCIVGPQRLEALDVIEAKAASVNAPLKIFGEHWSVNQRRDKSFHYYEREAGLPLQEGRGLDIRLDYLSLKGIYQYYNAGAAIAVANELEEFGVGEAHILKGIHTAHWPARMQPLKAGPLLKRLGAPDELWLDGGHNEEGGAILARQASEWKDAPCYAIVGMIGSKDAKAFFSAWQGCFTGVYTVTIPGEPNARPAEELAADARAQGVDAVAAGSLETAVDAIHAAHGDRKVRVIVCGSLYLAGHVLKTHR